MPDNENQENKEPRMDKTESEAEVGSGVRPLVTETEAEEEGDRDQGASSGQKGQPGIPDPEKEEWSPGSSQTT